MTEKQLKRSAPKGRQKKAAEMKRNCAGSTKEDLVSIYELLHEYYGPQRWWPARTKFEVIIGAILTQNTGWRNVERAICNLSRARLLTPDSMRRVSGKRLARLIRPAGYYNMKTERLKCFISHLFRRYDGGLGRMFSRPQNELREELLQIKGLGKETVDSILLYAGGRAVFVIDAYTRRVFSRHGFISGEESYDVIQRFFEDNLPHSARLFNEYHALIVGVAKDFCRKDPRCRGCPLEALRNPPKKVSQS